VYQKYNVLSNRQLPIGPAVPTRRGNVISGALQPLTSGTPQDRKCVSEQFTVADSRQKYPASGKTSQKATFWIAHQGKPWHTPRSAVSWLDYDTPPWYTALV